MTDQTTTAAFLSTVQGKLITFLAALALLLGVGTEAVLIYKNVVETEIMKAAAHNAEVLKSSEAEIAKQKAEVELQTARNSERFKAAEADKMQAEADSAKLLIEINKNNVAKSEAEAIKAKADATVSQEAAANAKTLKKAEAERAVQGVEITKDVMTRYPNEDIAGKAQDEVERRIWRQR